MSPGGLKPVPLLQVLLFAEEQNLRDYGRAVWVAFEEVATFYQRAMPELSYHRFVYDSGGTDPDTLRAEWSEAPGVAPGLGSSLWQSLRSRPSAVFDQEKMVDTVRRALGERCSDSRLLVCTDQQIRPPEDWRYILWDVVGKDVVVSTAAMDPNYWGARIPDRVATIKHRMRTAALSGTGEQLGLKRCSKAICLLYREVVSVECLDTMLLLGREHGVSSLEGLGFDPRPREPGERQEILEMRGSGGLESA